MILHDRLMEEVLKKLGKITIKEEENGNLLKTAEDVPESEEDDEVVVVPQASDTLGNEAIDEALATLPSRWRNYIVRAVFAVVMVALVGSLFSFGLPPVILLVALFEVECYREMALIAQAILGSRNYSSSLSWYMLLVGNYLCCSPLIGSFLTVYFQLPSQQLDRYRYSVSFVLFLGSLFWVILTLRRRHVRNQLLLWVWYISFATFFSFVASLFLHAALRGLVWAMLPVALVSLNDIMAYLCGFFFGRTRLTQLSPKKTWEGFVGGCILTVVFGLLMAHVLCGFPYFICPASQVGNSLQFGLCSPDPMFQLATYQLPDVITSVINISEIHTYPFVMTHAVYFALFASIIAPFGGFVCSGFKRAFHLKDFGGIIPGHGGLMDRLDCMFLMILFVSIYIYEVVGLPVSLVLTPDKFLALFLQLSPSDRQDVFQLLQNNMAPL